MLRNIVQLMFIARRHGAWCRIFAFLVTVGLLLGFSEPRQAQAAPVDCANTAVTGVPQAECEALVAFYNSTNGPGWYNKTNWNTATAVSTWYGITITNGRVTRLSLSGNALNGNIPDLGTFSLLERLDLAYNQLSGSIPDLSQLVRLQDLRLNNNRLKSEIPLSIMEPPLIGLFLCGGDNIITSSKPAVITWMQARHFSWTQGCGVSNAPVSVDDLDYSTPFYTSLSINAPGVLENDTLGTPAGTLISFGGGSLGGAVTDYAAGTTVNPLPGYSDGSLQLNADGSFVFMPPAEFASTYTFQYRLGNSEGAADANVTILVFVPVDCTDTMTTGVPQAECDVLVALFNNTNGAGWPNRENWRTHTALDSWYGITVSEGYITNIYLGNNHLTGTIPNLSALTQLQGLHLHNNQLSGNIPDLSAFTNLRSLSLSGNQLSGTIPNLSALTWLKSLSLSNNQLSGTIPALPARLFLSSINLSYNQLTGDIPNLSGFTSLQGLYLDHNQLTGSIPDLSGLISLSSLYLDHNQLTGNIPDLSKNTRLDSLYLDNNQLSGTIPELFALTRLNTLSLANNNLTGHIPNLSSNTKLKYMRVGHKYPP